MLKKFDIYVIKKYFTTFFFTMCLITLVAVAMNFFENVDKLVGGEVKLRDVFLIYYPNFIPWINGLLWPLFALLAVIFFTSRMARDSEIIATLSSGVSYNRILRPFFIGGLILSFLLWLGNNYIIPNSSRKKIEFESEYIRKSSKSTKSSDIHFFLSPTEKAYFRLYSSRDSTARNFRVERFKNGRLVYILKAESLKYIASTKKWKLSGIERHAIQGISENFQINTSAELDTNFVFKPEDFIRYSKQMEMMTTSELKQFMDEERDKGLDDVKKYNIELYRRTADPFTILILTMIGASIATRKVRGGMGLHLAFGVILGSIFVIMSKFSITFATNLSLPALLGVWIPNIIFSIVAFVLYKYAQK